MEVHKQSRPQNSTIRCAIMLSSACVSYIIPSPSMSTSHWAGLLCTCITKGKDLNIFGKKLSQMSSADLSCLTSLDIGHEISIIGLQSPFGHQLLAYEPCERRYCLTSSRLFPMPRYFWHIQGFNTLECWAGIQTAWLLHMVGNYKAYRW